MVTPIWLEALALVSLICALVCYVRMAGYRRIVQSRNDDVEVVIDRIAWLVASRAALARAVGATYVGAWYRSDPDDVSLWRFSMPAGLQIDRLPARQPDTYKRNV
jgi:hypothetical protein